VGCVEEVKEKRKMICEKVEIVVQRGGGVCEGGKCGVKEEF